MSYSDIPGYSGFLQIYRDAVKHFPSGSKFVEVGVALGHSIAFLAREVIDSGKDIEIYAVDPWMGIARNGEQQQLLDGPRGDMGLFVEMMIKHAPEELERIRILRLESIRARLVFPMYSLDMVMIDGAHDLDSVIQDISAWSPCMRPGGWLCGDDHEPNYPGVEEACVQELGKNYEVIGTSWRKRM